MIQILLLESLPQILLIYLHPKAVFDIGGIGGVASSA
jgi:hypothetical protein